MKKNVFKAIATALCVSAIAISSVCAAYATADEEHVKYDYNINDVTTTQRILANYQSFTEEDVARFDASRNGVIDINDVTLIQRHLAKFIDLNNPQD